MVRFCHRRLGCLLLLASWTATAFGQSENRTWRDGSGKFRVDAKLVERNEQQVKLLKSDGRVISVPVSVLSEDDQAFLKQLDEAQAANPFAGGELMEGGRTTGGAVFDPTDIEELPTDGPEIFLAIEEAMPAVTADPLPYEFKLVPFARPIEKLDAYARMSRPVILDPAKAIFALSTHREANAVDATSFGRIYAVSRETKQPRPIWNTELTLSLVDHHVASDRSLAVVGLDGPSDRGGDLVLMGNLAKGSPAILRQWHLPEYQKPGFKPKVEFGFMLDAAHAIVRVNNTAYLWSLETGETKFRIDLSRHGKIAVSGGGNYIAVPLTSGCKVVDVKKGELLGSISFPGLLTPEARFSPDGTRLALVAGNQFVVWNLESAGVEREETVGSTLGALYGWVDGKHLLTQFALLDVELAQAVWSYGLPPADNVQTVPGGVLIADKSSTPGLMASLAVPHEPVVSVQRALQKVDSSMLAIKPGSPVKLEVNAPAGVDSSEMEAGLKTAVERAGWKVSPASDVRVVATIERGEPQKMSFRSMTSPVFGESETVTIKPYRASLEIVQGGKKLWHSSSQNMVPFIIHLKDGQSLQSALKEYEKPDPAYFSRVTIPPKVFKAEFQVPVGRSRIVEGVWKQ